MSLIERISRLMSNKKNIRNVVLVAHIDHGKTTLSDSLLAAAGILAPSTAGEARALDFLPEEQRRGITMKTANISLVFQEGAEEYLVNLIDSPGHVDFSGKVARALRIADGAIVVIDAVEQIMAQTETVIRQCITEGVKPILFINKIDRLINELKLTPRQIAERIEIIYNNFNDLISKYSQERDVPKWKCTPRDGSVVFGSALHRWAVSVPIVKETKLTFEKITEFYHANNYQQLQDLLPIAKPLLAMIINHLPNPVIAQKYRIRNIWHGELQSPQGQAMINCQSEENDPVIFCTSKILTDPHAGILVLGRVFSGILREKMEVYEINSKVKNKIQNIYIYMGQDKKRINNIPAGNTVAFSGLKGVHTGETIVDSRAQDIVPFEEIKYLATPVVTIAIEPTMLRDLPKLKHVLEKQAIEDPNLMVTVDDKSGEILLMGIGELHLETVVKDISSEIQCEASPPLVIIVDKIEKESKVITKELFGSKIKVKVIPIQDTSPSQVDNSSILNLKQYNNQIIVNAQIVTKFNQDSIENMVMGAKEALSEGPISSKPVYGVSVELLDFTAPEGEKFEHSLPLVRNAIWEALKDAKISTQEPIYHIQITAPAQYLGKVSSIINKRRGIISDVRSEQDLLIISGSLPVAESFRIDQALRSETEGRAFWQMSFEKYAPLPTAQLETLNNKKN